MVCRARVLKLAKEKHFVCANGLEGENVPRRYVPRLEKRGSLERVACGIYALPDRDITQYHDLALAPKRCSSNTDR